MVFYKPLQKHHFNLPLLITMPLNNIQGNSGTSADQHGGSNWNQALLDALPDPICILDVSGTILTVNKAWRDFATSNSLVTSNVDEGSNYFSVCEAAVGKDASQAREALNGLQAVARGELSEFTMEYPCHSLEIERWYQMRVVCLRVGEVNQIMAMHRNIAERKQWEWTFYESDDRFMILFQSSPVATSITSLEEGVIMDVNPAFLEMVGYKRQEIVGRFAREIDLWVDPEKRESLVQRLHAEGGVQRVEAQFRKKSGEIGTVLISAVFVELRCRRYILAMGVDCTERRKVEEALRASEERFRVALTSGQIVVFNQDCELRYTWIGNPALGLKPEEAIGRTDEQLLGAEMAAPLMAFKRCVLENGRGKRQEFYLVRNGQVGYFDLIVEPMYNNSGKIVGITCAAVDITQRKQTEVALRESEVVRRQALDSSPDAVFAIDRNYRLLFNNQRHQKALVASGGKPFEVGENVLSSAYPLEVLAWWRSAYDRALHGEDFRLETEWTDIEGGPQVSECTFSPLRDAGGDIIGALIIAHNITERKQVERRLKADLEAIAQLQKIGTIYVREGNLESVLDRILEAAITITGADFGNIQLLDPVVGDLRIVVQRGFPKWWLDYWSSVEKGRGSCGTAIQHSKRIIVENIEESPIFVGTSGLEVQLRAGVRAVQSTPLIGRAGEMLGMISTHYKMPHCQDERQLQILDLLSSQIADILQRIEREKLLRENNMRFQIALAAAPIVVSNQDLDLRYTWMRNPPMGLTIEEVIGRTDDDILGVEEAKPLTTIKRRILRTGCGERQEIQIKLAGLSGWFDLIAEPLRDSDGQIIGINSAGIDITERKQAELALRENEMRFRTMVEQAPEGIFIQTQCRFAYVNAVIVRLFGAADPSQLLGEMVENRVHPDFRARVRERIRLLNEEGLPQLPMDIIFVKLDGSPQDANVCGVPYIFNGEHGALVFVRDITEQKRLEAERAEAMARLSVVEEEERHRISLDLHDQIAQRLVALAVELKSLETNLDTGRLQIGRVQSLRKAVDNLQQQVREIAWDMRAGDFMHGGLVSVLQDYIEDWSERTHLQVDNEFRGLEEKCLPLRIEAAMYRVVQEALANIEKHAQACRVSVLLEYDGSVLRLTVEDNGQGFDVDAVQKSQEGALRLGLLGMKERVALVGGTLMIESSTGAGTTIFVRIPIHEEVKP